MVEGEAGGRDGERASGRDALFVEGIARRPAARRAFGPAVAVSADVGGGQLGRERQQRVRLQPPDRGGPAEASVPSSARRNAPRAVSAAGPGVADRAIPPARQAVTNTR